VLRPYQKHGVGWMHFLRNNGFGGILADEMGLGKTLQALAFLSAVGRASLPGKSVSENRSVLKSENAHLPGRDARPAGGRPHLVVCPTSLVFNWAAEAAKFTPELKVVTLQGPDRHKRFAEIADADLVVTSYALVRRDAERYRAIEFDTVVLDEAQHIKNRQTQNAQAVKAIRSQHRLVLTGTPLENSVLDLWSIFDFLMPGYLGTAQDFRDRYEQPITKTRDADAQARLARRLKPFLLRRLKREVAKELPDKLEQISFCDLSDEQAQVYKQVLDATRREVVMAVDQNGLAKSRMVVLSALLRLRQICCDLRLLKLEEPVGPTSMPGESVSENRNVPKLEDAQLPGRDARPATPAPSGKLEMFSELLEEVVDGEHRVLVFSQFVGMLTLLRERLEADGIEYCYLDGSTKDRGEAVRGFQTGKAPVFLISLKAGGVGLNLTGADTVIHFDPWWNPAVEDQATDRAHRIGQTRVVTSYKLITRGTIEEKIVQLQKKKRDIIAATLTGEEALTGSLNWAEIQDLLG
jgi:SNF2 family DNA or RNA helicase